MPIVHPPPPIRKSGTDQVNQFHLPPIMRADEKQSSNLDKFVAAHGPNVFELEALLPADLQSILRQAIDSVIDRSAFEAEVEAEAEDAAHRDKVWRRIRQALASEDIGGDI